MASLQFHSVCWEHSDRPQVSLLCCGCCIHSSGLLWTRPRWHLKLHQKLFGTYNERGIGVKTVTMHQAQVSGLPRILGLDFK